MRTCIRWFDLVRQIDDYLGSDTYLVSDFDVFCDGVDWLDDDFGDTRQDRQRE